MKIEQLWVEENGNVHPLVRNSDLLEILALALTHDAHEIEYGDPPSPAVALAPEAHAKGERRFWEQRGGRSSASFHAQCVVRLADKLEALFFYTLEGDDPRLKARCEASVRQCLIDIEAPPAVGLWASLLLESVRAGTFTPQPNRNP